MIALRVDRFESLHRLVDWYVAGQITADEYFDAVDAWAKVQVEAEVNDLTRRRMARR